MKEKIARHDMPCQDPVTRARNFEEVALGYSEETAIAEAKRCLQCKKSLCVTGCPVEVQIPEFIRRIAEGDFAAAGEVLKQKIPCRQYAGGFARRSPSARANVSWG